jgi:hypothetical protein
MGMAIRLGRRHRYDRKRPTKDPRPSIVVLVEGAVTEVEYLSALRDTLGIPRTLMAISSAIHSDADGLVKEARELLRPARGGRRASENGVPDEVWVVSDTESEHGNGSPENIAHAINRAGDHVYLVLDSPSIEYWFLLHFKYTTRCYESAKVVIDELQKDLPDYSKQEHSQDWAYLIGRTNIALRNASQVRKHRESADLRQPIADADILVARMMGLGKNELPSTGDDSQGSERNRIPLPTREDLYSRKHLHGRQERNGQPTAPNTGQQADAVGSGVESRPTS